VKDLLIWALEKGNADYLEIRYHSREVTSIKVATGALEQANFTDYSGVGIRALVRGAWGFSSTSKLTREHLGLAVNDAIKAAKAAAPYKSKKVKLADARMAKGRFKIRENGPLKDVSFEEKMKLVTETEKNVRKGSKQVKSAMCLYRELLDNKIILNSDGADAEIWEPRADFYVYAIATENENMVMVNESEGIAGGWKDIFRRRSSEEIAEKVSKTATSLLNAPYPKGGKVTTILDPSLVGLISHEAFGHTVEADFVLSGSAAKDRIGTQVASNLVTMVDCGMPDKGNSPAGSLMVDDEGVKTQKAIIIEKGILKSYLCDRETAAIFDVEPKGNSRAFEYSDDPLIRMRNTYIEPGDWTFDEIIEDTREGYLLVNAGGGQADANAEFMFTANETYEVKKGEIGKLVRGAAISGNAFDVLGSVDAIGRDFAFNMGSGFCGKGQPAKVDGGGGHVRCSAIIGGRQEG
jgi:TldD protein